jgi:hypothetical protein
MPTDMLQPAAVLILWTLAMLGWTLAIRLPAMRAAGIDLGKLTGGKGTDADGVLPARTQWKAHNYNHLLEQPVLFYAASAILAIAGDHHPINLGLAWAYVGLRIAHSLWQATVNRVSVRFALFVAASLVLLALGVHAAVAVF